MSVPRWCLACGCISMLGCTAQMGERGGVSAVDRWLLASDDDLALVDVRHPDLAGYPNRGGFSSLEVTLFRDGRLCASAGQAHWCGGPVQGIPYTARGRVERDRLCIQVLDLYGNRVGEYCDVGMAATQGDLSASVSCQTATNASGVSCKICTDAVGVVTDNTCDALLPGDERTTCADGAHTGADLFVEAFNDNLARVGFDGWLTPPDRARYVDFDRGEVSLGEPSCADVLEYLDDEFSDDHSGTNDWVFGSEAIDECLNGGRCKVGQLVTRSLATACSRVPIGCSLRDASEGIIGAGGYAIESVCPGRGQKPAFGKIEKCVGSPLVLDPAGDGLALTGLDRGVRFDVRDAVMRTGWLAGSDDALLALDVNGDGAITSGRELFGEATGGWAPDGFAALARHDVNADGLLDRSDPVYDDLVAWVDDGDAVSNASELLPLQSLGITAIPLSPETIDDVDEHGNQVGLQATARGEDGQSVPVYDVWFAIRTD